MKRYVALVSVAIICMLLLAACVAEQSHNTLPNANIQETPAHPNTPNLPTPDVTSEKPEDKPSEPTEPEKPVEPSEPQQPVEPETPTEPEQPDEPEKPTEPEKPVEPVEIYVAPTAEQIPLYRQFIYNVSLANTQKEEYLGRELGVYAAAKENFPEKENFYCAVQLSDDGQYLLFFENDVEQRWLKFNIVEQDGMRTESFSIPSTYKFDTVNPVAVYFGKNVPQNGPLPNFGVIYEFVNKEEIYYLACDNYSKDDPSYTETGYQEYCKKVSRSEVLSRLKTTDYDKMIKVKSGINETEDRALMALYLYSKGKDYDYFSVVDSNNDGSPEVIVKKITNGKAEYSIFCYYEGTIRKVTLGNEEEISNIKYNGWYTKTELGTKTAIGYAINDKYRFEEHHIVTKTDKFNQKGEYLETVYTDGDKVISRWEYDRAYMEYQSLPDITWISFSQQNIEEVFNADEVMLDAEKCDYAVNAANLYDEISILRDTGNLLHGPHTVLIKGLSIPVVLEIQDNSYITAISAYGQRIEFSLRNREVITRVFEVGDILVLSRGKGTGSYYMAIYPEGYTEIRNTTRVDDVSYSLYKENGQLKYESIVNRLDGKRTFLSIPYIFDKDEVYIQKGTVSKQDGKLEFLPPETIIKACDEIDVEWWYENLRETDDTTMEEWYESQKLRYESELERGAWSEAHIDELAALPDTDRDFVETAGIVAAESSKLFFYEINQEDRTFEVYYISDPLYGYAEVICGATFSIPEEYEYDSIRYADFGGGGGSGESGVTFSVKNGNEEYYFHIGLVVDYYAGEIERIGITHIYILEENDLWRFDS